MSIFYVTTSNDSVSGSLRYVIDKANHSNCPAEIVITPDVCKSMILSGGEIKISSNLRVVNKTGRDLTIIGGDFEERLFNILPSSTRTIFESSNTKLFLSGGKAKTNGGTILVNSPSHVLILDGIVVSGNRAVKGGGIYTAGRIILNSSTVRLNQAFSQGGGIWSEKGVIATESQITENQIIIPNESSAGDGIFVDNGNCTLNKSSVSHNKVIYTDSTGGSGGGIVVMVGDIYVQNDSHVDDNEAYNSGGIQEGQGNIYLTNGSSASRNKSTNSNRGSAGGGGIIITQGNVFVYRSDIVDNTTVGMYSGGIVSLVGDVIIQHSKILRNSNRCIFMSK